MRYATPISTRGYRALLGAVVMAVVGSTAACSDEATAPTPVAAAELRGPQASINRFPPVGATVTVRIADILGQTINEALSVKFYLNGSFTDTVTVWDNSAMDKDPAIGKFKVTVHASAFYKVCAQGLSKSFGTDYYLDACKTITTNQLSFDAGTVVAHRLPKIAITLQSQVGFSIKGAAAEFTYAPGLTAKFNDQFTAGTIVVSLPQPGSYPYCEVAAPTGYQFVNFFGSDFIIFKNVS